MREAFTLNLIDVSFNSSNCPDGVGHGIVLKKRSGIKE